MKIFKYFSLLLLALPVLSSCSDDEPGIEVKGQPVVTAVNLPSTAFYGDSLHFQVQCSDADGIALSTLKAYMEYSGEQVSSQVIRTKTEGTYDVALYAPIYKAVPDGSAQVRLVLQNICLALTEQVIDLPLSRPHYDHISFIASNGTEYTMTPDAQDPYLFTCAYTSANKTFKGHFAAPAYGSNGTPVVFGQGNEEVTQGVSDEISFTGNKGSNTVSFNVLSYVFGPQTSDPSSSTEILLTKSDNTYVGELQQGHLYEFAGESIINSSRWWNDPDWFTKNGDGTYTFLGITGTYSITADFTNLASRIWVMNGSNSGTLNADGTGAIWVIGNNGIGKPSYTASNVQSWWTGEDYDYCLTPISEKVHRITLTVGKQLNGSDVNFKFFGQAAWGTEFKGSASTYHLSTDSDVFLVGDGNDGHDDGNIYLQDGAELQDGDTYVFTIDLSNGCSNGILTITKQ